MDQPAGRVTVIMGNIKVIQKPWEEAVPHATAKVGPFGMAWVYPPGRETMPEAHYEAFTMKWMEVVGAAVAGPGLGGCVAVYCDNDRLAAEVLETATAWGWGRKAWDVVAYGPTCRDFVLVFQPAGPTVEGGQVVTPPDKAKPPAATGEIHPGIVMGYIEQCTSHGDVVLDPFAGMGWTAVAAGRYPCRCVCIEQDPDLCRIIKELA